MVKDEYSGLFTLTEEDDLFMVAKNNNSINNGQGMQKINYTAQEIRGVLIPPQTVPQGTANVSFMILGSASKVNNTHLDDIIVNNKHLKGISDKCAVLGESGPSKTVRNLPFFTKPEDTRVATLFPGSRKTDQGEINVDSETSEKPRKFIKTRAELIYEILEEDEQERRNQL